MHDCGAADDERCRSDSRSAAPLDHEVVIVGSGFSGIGAAVALRKMGIEDFVLLEREKEFGGTWVQHAYPGLEIDMPFFVYSYPFEPRWSWSQLYPTGEELLRLHPLLRREIRRHPPHPLRQERVEGRVRRSRRTSGGRRSRAARPSSSRYLVNATGLLVIPKMPDIDGHRGLRGEDHPHRALGPRLRSRGQTRRRDRHRCDVDPARPRDRRSRGRHRPLPAHARSGSCRSRTRSSRPDSSACCGAFPSCSALMRWSMNLLVEVVFGLGFIRYARFPGIFRAIEKRLVEFIRSEVRRSRRCRRS